SQRYSEPPVYEIADVRTKRLEDQASRGVDRPYQIFLSKRSSSSQSCLPSTVTRGRSTGWPTGAHVERRRGGAFFLVAAHMDVVVAGATRSITSPTKWKRSSSLSTWMRKTWLKTRSRYVPGSGEASWN